MMKPTKEQLKAAAIALCLEDGLDPDELIQVPSTGAMRRTCRWGVVSDEIERQLAIQRAIDAALDANAEGSSCEARDDESQAEPTVSTVNIHVFGENGRWYGEHAVQWVDGSTYDNAPWVDGSKYANVQRQFSETLERAGITQTGCTVIALYPPCGYALMQVVGKTDS